MKKFESTNPSKISIVGTRYKNYHMTKGQSVLAYMTMMKEYHNQLAKMGDPIADSTHCATILRNVLESGAQTICMIVRDSDEIDEKLEPHEADIGAIRMSTQDAMAFIALARPPKCYNNPVNRPANNPPTTHVSVLGIIVVYSYTLPSGNVV
jgi:gag-polypeptide of LTR copia-type